MLSHLCPSLPKKILEEGERFGGEDAGGDFAAVVEAAQMEEIQRAASRVRLWTAFNGLRVYRAGDKNSFHASTCDADFIDGDNECSGQGA